MSADRPTLRAFLWCPAAALRRLTRTWAIARAPRLTAKHHRNAEPGNITLKEYQANPENYVMIAIEAGRTMLFAGSNGPLAYLELKSIDLPTTATQGLSEHLCSLMAQELDIEKNRTYIEFADAPRRMWGWNGGTF
ncbi:hypothetical protein JYT26_00535 [Beggiatoa alba]|nr:hypothetical protein [Beggiatoa alba]